MYQEVQGTMLLSPYAVILRHAMPCHLQRVR